MADPNWAETATAWATIAGAVASCATAGVALFAALTWKYTLKNQRADDLIGASRELAGSIGRCISLKIKEAELNNKQRIWDAYDQVWASYVKLHQTFSAARRYHQQLPGDIPDHIHSKLHELGDTLHGNWSPGTFGLKDARNTERAISELLQPVYGL